ncbi:hypothetical protein [Marinobacter santoriniensis]|uniref:hypothetical protein n=1 Tax=Marinobacter santoriniensis TaxID=523742 RepID=UPI001269CAA6|nr:hypothetical protein [Marinobacter santoriniensis]
MHKWDVTDEMSGLIFFAQRMDELLFDYTLDSYKSMSLNAPYLCREALRLIKDVEEELIEEGNLPHVLDELEWSIQNDKLAKDLLDVDLDYYILKSKEDSLHEKRKRLEALSKTIGPSRYLWKCKERLYEEIVAKNKKAINNLSATFATTLINFGYSKTYIYTITKNFFFIGSEPRIDSCERVKDYFDNFDQKVHYYDAVFLVDPLVRTVSQSVKAFQIDVHDKLNEELEHLVMEHEFFADGEYEGYQYVQVKGIRAYDYQKARTMAERKIDNLSDLFSLFYHKNQISWRRDAIVRKLCCDSISTLERPHKGPMEKGFDYKPAKAAKELNRLISSFALKNQSSFQKFNRVADLHGICISNDIVENQLVNLWTAIETLVPSHVGSNKINGVINFILPFIVVSYIYRLVSRFVADMFIWDRRITRRFLDQVESSDGVSLYVKALNLLALEENQQNRNELYEALKDFHLLRFRAFSLHEILSKPRKLQEVIEVHKTKVSWQVRRMYRTRNLIVHTGQTPTYLEALIENGHDYLDQIMEGIIEFSCGSYRTQSLEQVFELAKIQRIRFDRHLKNLEHVDRDSIRFLCERGKKSV